MRAYVSVAIVVLIVLLTLGMLAPKLSRLQKDANRTYCEYNLHTVFKAMDAYHGQAKALPTGTVLGVPLRPEERVSWMAALLPYLKEEELAKLVDVKAAWTAPANAKARELGVPHYHCPALVNRQQSRSTPLTHFPGMAGLGEDAASLPAEHPRAGVFGYERARSFAEIQKSDGTSVTILILETAHENGPWIAGGNPTVRGLIADGPPSIGPGGQFGGAHAAGANALFADGSARLITADVAPAVLEALITLGSQ